MSRHCHCYCLWLCLCRLSSHLIQSLFKCFLPYFSLHAIQFSNVLTAKESFLMSVLTYWETRPFTPAFVRVHAPALLFVIVNKLWFSFGDGGGGGGAVSSSVRETGIQLMSLRRCFQYTLKHMDRPWLVAQMKHNQSPAELHAEERWAAAPLPAPPRPCLQNTLPSRLFFLQCCGSVTFWYGSGSADPYLWLTNFAN